MASTTNLKALARLMRYEEYRRYTIGNSISLIGTWMQRVTVGWLAWELTGSGTWLGLIAFADLFPTILVGPVAGAAADRWSLTALLKVTQVLGLLQAALLTVLYVGGMLDITTLFVITTLLGVIGGFAQPARLSIISNVVPRTDLGSAVAMNAVVFNLARFVGPACAGLLLASAGVAWAFAANALSYLVFVIALWGLTPVTRPARSQVGTGMLADIFEGFGYVGRTPGVLPIMLLTIAMGFGARPAVELLAGFASGVLGGGASALAMLTSSVGVGAIVGGSWMVGRAASGGLTRIFALCAAGSAVAVMLLAAAPSLYWAVPATIIAGFFMVCTGISAQVLLQLSVSEAIKGRLLSTYGLLVRGVPAIGALLVGAISELVGFRWALSAGAVALLFAAGLVFRRSSVIAQHLEVPRKNMPSDLDAAS